MPGLGKARSAGEIADSAVLNRDSTVLWFVARSNENGEPIKGHRILGGRNVNWVPAQIPPKIAIADGHMARILDTQTMELSNPMPREEALAICNEL
jgi:hypothetical protein